MNDPKWFTAPAVGDAVNLKGRILKLDAGVALVEVYRSYPTGGTVTVQCGGLELTEDPGGDEDILQAEKISGEDPLREYQDALDEHARNSGAIGVLDASWRPADEVVEDLWEGLVQSSFKPMYGRVTQADRSLVSTSTSGWIRSKEVQPEYEDED